MINSRKARCEWNSVSVWYVCVECIYFVIPPPFLIFFYFYLPRRINIAEPAWDQLTGSRDRDVSLASQHKMELSDSVVKGLQPLADPACLDLKSFIIFTEAAFRSLLSFPTGSVFGKISRYCPLYSRTSGWKPAWSEIHILCLCLFRIHGI